jgi:hypothetical protein
MLIPVFGSCPTYVDDAQALAQRLVYGELNRQGFEVRTVGKTDYPINAPLREVAVLARHCSGGVILGFSQFETASGVAKKGTPVEKKESGRLRFPTPWNHLEAGILFSLGLPLLVFRDDGVSGGIFDAGAAEIFVHELPKSNAAGRRALKELIQKWGSEVRELYYRSPR